MKDNAKNNIIRDNSRLLITIAALIALGILMQVGAAFLVDVITELLEGSSSVASYGDAISSLTTLEPKMVVYVIAVSPLIEEIVFRLGLLGLGSKIIKFWIADLVQAILFGVYHGNLIQGTYAFIFGLIFGYLFYRLGFYANLLMHIVINAAGLYLTPLLPATYPMPVKVAAGIACLGVSAGIILYIHKCDVKRLPQGFAG